MSANIPTLGNIIPVDKVTTLVSSTSNSVTPATANEKLENETMLLLAKGDAAYTSSSNINGSNIYNSSNLSGSNETYKATKFSTDEMTTCELVTTPGLHSGDFAILSKHNAGSVVYNSETVNVGVLSSDYPSNPNSGPGVNAAPATDYNKTFSIDSPSMSLYDAHIECAVTNNDGPFYDNEGNPNNHRFEATFSSSAPYALTNHFHKQLNSRYGNTTNTDPLYVQEDTVFNTQHSLGLDSNGNANYTEYFTINNDGSRTVNTLSVDKQLSPAQGWGLTLFNSNELNEQSYGAYRVQQLPASIQVDLYNGTVDSSNLQDDTFGRYYPITSGISQDSSGIIYDISGNVATLIEDPIRERIFNTLFDSSGSQLSSYILPDFNYNLKITSGTNSGFSFDSNGTKENDITVIDDSALDNNLELMKKWISDTSINCNLKYNYVPLLLTTDTSSSFISHSENITGVTAPISVSNSEREALEEQYIDSDGHILLNLRTAATRANVIRSTGTGFTNTKPYVYYNKFTSTDNSGNITGSTQPLNTIPTAFKTNYDVNMLTQLVVKKPVAAADKFKTSGDSTLNLVSESASGAVINSNFSSDAANWDFTSYVAGEIGKHSILRIKPQLRLDDIEGLKDSTGTIVNNIHSVVYFRNEIKPQTTSITGRAFLTLREVQTLGLSNSLDSLGWELRQSTSTFPNLSTSSMGTLLSDSQNAYAAYPRGWPSIDAVYSAMETGNTIPYRFTFKCGANSSDVVSSDNYEFNDRVVIDWGKDFSGNYLNQIIISQAEMTRIDISQDNSGNMANVVQTNVPNTEYTLSDILTGRNVNLVKFVSTKVYSSLFNPRLRPYSNLFVKTPTMTVRTEFYVLKDAITNNEYPIHYLKQYVHKNTDSSFSYASIKETLINGNDKASIEGELDVTDLYNLSCKIQLNTTPTTTATWQTISESKNISTFFHQVTNPVTTFNLLPNYDNDTTNDTTLNGDIDILLEYRFIGFGTGVESQTTLNDTNGYSIKLAARDDIDFNVSYWKTDATISTLYNNGDLGFNLKSTSSLGDTSGNFNELTITPTNGYSSIPENKWLSGYTGKVEFTDTVANGPDKTTNLKIYDPSGVLSYQISLKNNRIFGPSMYIATGLEDIWRVRTTLNGIPSEIFRGTVYNETNYDNYNGINSDALKVCALANGVYLDKNDASNNVDFTDYVVGDTCEFSLKPDLFSINLVGPIDVSGNQAVAPLQPFNGVDLSGNYINGLQHKYMNGDYFSKTVTFSGYRGFVEKETDAIDALTSTNHRYFIDRTKMTATWEWELTDISGNQLCNQTLDVFKGTQAFNDLDTTNAPTRSLSYTGFNLKLQSKYSSLSDSDAIIYPITQIGDTVTITLTNPRNNGVPELNTTLTSNLRQTTVYQFPGSNYNSTGAPLTFTSTRLKFASTLEVPISTATETNFSITKYEPQLNIYHRQIDIGNPESRGGSDATDTELPPATWGPPIRSVLSSALITGIQFVGGNSGDIAGATGAFRLTRPGGGTSAIPQGFWYFIVHRPMLKFTATAHNTNTNNAMPYNYSTYTANNFYNPTANGGSGLIYQGNKITYSLPVTFNPSGYYPFQTSIMGETLHSGYMNNTDGNFYKTVNNIRFIDTSNRSYIKYRISPLSSQYNILVKGQNMHIRLNIGLKLDTSGNANPAVSTLFNNAATDLLALTSFESGFNLRRESTELGGLGVKLSFRQDSTPPYLSGTGETDAVLADGTGNTASNIFFTVPNFFAKSGTVVKLDIPAGAGTQMNLYTREIIKDSGSYKVCLYKYEAWANSVIDWNNFNRNDKTAVTVHFQTRYKKLITIPNRAIEQTTIEKFNDRLNKITWQNITGAGSWLPDSVWNALRIGGSYTDGNGNTISVQNGDNKTVWFSFCSLNYDCVESTLPKFFVPPNTSGYGKMNIVTRGKVFTVQDKLGHTIAELNHDSIMALPGLTTVVNTVNSSTNGTAPLTASDIINRSSHNYQKLAL